MVLQPLRVSPLTATSQHWSLLQLHRLFCPSLSRSIPLVFTLSRSVSSATAQSTRTTTTPRQDAKNQRTPKDQKDSRGKSSRDRDDRDKGRAEKGARDHDRGARDHDRGARDYDSRGRISRGGAFRTGELVARNPIPYVFQTIPDTQSIESVEKEWAHALMIKRPGTGSVTNEAFTIKAGCMPFRKPAPAPELPVIVRKAILQYESEMAHYDLQLQNLTSTSPLPKPKLPPIILQHHLRNVRQYPATLDAPHPPFRVSYILSKKGISKFSTYRSFARKKLSAATEAVFRDHARQGFEYLIFGKPACLTTRQADLIELMKKALAHPGLYPGRDAAKQDSNTSSKKMVKAYGNPATDQPTTTTTTTAESSTPSDQHDTVKVRWRNNQAPLHKEWWKHALPNPLGRVQHSDEYLDKLCQKSQEEPAASKHRRQ